MRFGRYVLAGVIAATLTTAACSAASGADRGALESASSSVAGQAAPAAGLLPRVDANSAGPSVAVERAVEATGRELARVAAAERKAAEVSAQKAARHGQGSQHAETAQAATKSDGGCAQRAMAAGKFDPSCSAYQGYLDPGTAAGRAPTSGEIQMQYACEQGLVPESDC
ncbi:hypothetical protein WIS52_15145 [Pseudonocardia nematodicida]|uniref:Lipoprotein n=1 Tax=Pseudonocardia nematodicida TaxID=1206997 RepID=A0ABV1KEN1_9PSEU